MTLSLAQVGGEAIIRAVERLAALVIAARAHRPLELDEIAIWALYRLQPSLSKSNWRFGKWWPPKLPHEIASLELVLTRVSLSTAPPTNSIALAALQHIHDDSSARSGSLGDGMGTELTPLTPSDPAIPA